MDLEETDFDNSISISRGEGQTELPSSDDKLRGLGLSEGIVRILDFGQWNDFNPSAGECHRYIERLRLISPVSASNARLQH